MGLFWNSKKEKEQQAQAKAEREAQALKEQQEAEELERRAKEIFVTTTDLKCDYEILAIVWASTFTELKQEALKRDADAVICCRINDVSVQNQKDGYYFNVQTRIYGTAVKLKNI